MPARAWLGRRLSLTPIPADFVQAERGQKRPRHMGLLSSVISVSSNVRMRKAINHLKKSDPVLRAIIDRVGPCRMEFGEPVFHSLAEAIVYQQLNGKAAVTIFKRFAAL